jgi:hypothetical protein
MMGMDDDDEESLRELAEWQQKETDAKEAEARRRLDESQLREEWGSAWRALSGSSNSVLGWHEDRVALVIRLAEVVQRQGYTEYVVKIRKRISLWFKTLDEPHAYHCPVLCTRPLTGDLRSRDFLNQLRGIESAAVVLHRAIQGRTEDLVPAIIKPNFLSSLSWECLGQEVSQGYGADYPVEPQLAPTTDGKMIGLFLAIRDLHVDTVEEWPRLKPLLQQRFGRSLSDRKLFEKLQSWILAEKDLDGSRADYLPLTEVIEWLEASPIVATSATTVKPWNGEATLPDYATEEFMADPIAAFIHAGKDYELQTFRMHVESKMSVDSVDADSDDIGVRYMELQYGRSCVRNLLKALVEPASLEVQKAGKDPQPLHEITLLAELYTNRFSEKWPSVYALLQTIPKASERVPREHELNCETGVLSWFGTTYPPLERNPFEVVEMLYEAFKKGESYEWVPLETMRRQLKDIRALDTGVSEVFKLRKTVESPPTKSNKKSTIRAIRKATYHDVYSIIEKRGGAGAYQYRLQRPQIPE